ncbi:MAG: M20 family metallopeptidase [Acidimicrobiia bacterium]|nr:M20 family metallopeptidase [Acidimicrobiia bacterium]
MEERVRSCFEAAALATGCRVEVRDYGHRYAELVHNPFLVELSQDRGVAGRGVGGRLG